MINMTLKNRMAKKGEMLDTSTTHATRSKGWTLNKQKRASGNGRSRKKYNENAKMDILPATNATIFGSWIPKNEKQGNKQPSPSLGSGRRWDCASHI